MQSPNWNQNQGGQGYGQNMSQLSRPGAISPLAQRSSGVSAGPWNPTQSFAGPGGINPAVKQSSQMGGPFNPYMPPQDYFRGVAPWGGNQSQLSQQNPMMSMGGQPRPPQMSQTSQGPGGMQPFVQPMQGYGQQRGFPANQPTSNPYMPQMQQPQPQPQQMPANPYNPYQSSQGWNQSGQFPGFRFPAY